MPTYEYRCPEGHEFDKFQKMSDEPVAACPECGADAERLLSAGAGVIFKGSGFYETDYRDESYTKAAKADRKTADGSDSDGSDDDAGDGSDGGSEPSSDAAESTDGDATAGGA